MLNSLSDVFDDISKKLNKEVIKTNNSKTVFGSDCFSIYENSKIDLNTEEGMFEFDDWRIFLPKEKIELIKEQYEKQNHKKLNLKDYYVPKYFNTPFFDRVQGFFGDNFVFEREFLAFFKENSRYILNYDYKIDGSNLIVSSLSLRKSYEEEIVVEDLIKRNELRNNYKKLKPQFGELSGDSLVGRIMDKMGKELNDKSFNPKKYFIKSSFSTNPEEAKDLYRFILNIAFNN